MSKETVNVKVCTYYGENNKYFLIPQYLHGYLFCLDIKVKNYLKRTVDV